MSAGHRTVRLLTEGGTSHWTLYCDTTEIGRRRVIASARERGYTGPIVRVDRDGDGWAVVAYDEQADVDGLSR